MLCNGDCSMLGLSNLKIELMELLIMSAKREYGDYQTPDFFALDICKYLKEKLSRLL